MKKLRAFRGHPFFYQHAVFLELPTDASAPYWRWITDGSDGRRTRVF